ncbi:CLUMA_CG008038, isoform A [Clunio marinus]|uniref:CLUMA_CG008038, isoform A n=1 Tax=Clunio marinus TaxID=568069 RepID=A0A1J1I2G4_9DIPT|nr:CLUMA_CG008038, isoform A [Clunio marinus]
MPLMLNFGLFNIIEVNFNHAKQNQAKSLHECTEVISTVQTIQDNRKSTQIQYKGIPLRLKACKKLLNPFVISRQPILLDKLTRFR